ncbi:MAG: poly-gamma-glutamate system protein [Candidatus Aminicenantes bacterium]|nr:poly-gamma-glutamate system protein [Candidatus Aminicenantes bacterium]
MAYFGLNKNQQRRFSPDSTEWQAAELMLQAEKATFSCEQRKGLQPERNYFDPNQTGLIGLEQSELTTTLGRLEAKRTTTNPQMSSLLVRLLKELGLRPGDSVAVAASSSFPALILAAICAAHSLNLDLMLIVSVGASQWGANNPDFTVLEMMECWRDMGLNRYRLLAISWGGEDNSGREFPEKIRRKVRDKAGELGLKILEPGPLSLMVKEQVALFQENARGPLKAFINIGGNLVCLGLDSSILELKPGLTRVKKIPPAETRGLVQEMASRGLPVIHLLNIQGLVKRYGLPWDPQPLPQPGQDIILRDAERERTWLRKIFVLYVLLSIFFVACCFFIHRRHGRKVL